MFPTASGKKAIAHPSARSFSAGQQGTGIITGTGKKIAWRFVDGCVELPIPIDILAEVRFKKDASTTEKGAKAVQVVSAMLRRGLIQLPVRIHEVQDKDLQIQGQDMIVFCKIAIQVKCDYWAAEYGLSLQTAECNPFGRH